MTEQVAPQILGEFRPWEYCLRTIYGQPASVSTIRGEWKTGKTNFALHITEECKRLGLISQIAANVQCFSDETMTKNSDEVLYIDNFLELEAWMYSGRRKAFIYDEAIKSTPSRRAMSELNTQWLKVVPELSKGRMHLIVVTQEEEYTESIFKHPTFRKTIWEKLNLRKTHPQYRKMVRLYCQLIPKRYRFVNIPPTKIVYDPYLSAIWQMSPTATSLERFPIEIQIAADYAHGLSTNAIVDKYKELTDRTDATRMIRKALNLMLEKLQVAEVKRRILDSENLQQQ